MTSTLTPPVPPHPDAPTPPPAQRGSSKVVAILAIVLGGVLILGTVLSASLSAVAAAGVRNETLTADVRGVTSLDVDVAAAEMTVAFADVDEASLDVTAGGGAGDWELRRDGDELVVTSDRSWWRGWRLFGWFGDDARATLTLPETLEGPDLEATLHVGSGSLAADGAFGDLELDISAGDLRVDGSAARVDLGVDAGRARIDLADVREAEIDLSAGSVEGRLAGTAPASLDVQVDAGSLDLRVPEGQYAVASDVSAGSFRHELDTSPTAANRITVSVAAGSVRLAESR